MLSFGAAQDELLASAASLIEQLQTSEHTSLLSMLLEGESGSGKSAIAATLALKSAFPFVKLISPNGLVGVSEAGKAAMIARTFDDAHKSPLSLVVCLSPTHPYCPASACRVRAGLPVAPR